MLVDSHCHLDFNDFEDDFEEMLQRAREQGVTAMLNAGNNIDITLLSSGIYEAMITTVGGLIVGIPSLFAYNYLVAKVDTVVNQLEAKTLAFMDLLNEEPRKD